MKLNSISMAVLIITALPIFVLQAQQQKSQSDVSAADLAVIQAQLTPDEFKEFQNWVSIGPGGLPHTLEGYRTLQALNKKLRDPLDVSNLISKIGKDGDVNSLKNLPKRSRPRPRIAPFAIPHRQLDQHNDAAIRAKQKEIFVEVTDQNKTFVHFQRSYFEKHNEAIFVNDSAQANQTIVSTTHGEVGHLHPSDGSMHFSLSPSDTKEVIEKGWGELHGLAGQVYKANDALPATYTMIYSPGTDQELAVVKQILEAAIRYSSTRSKDVK